MNPPKPNWTADIFGLLLGGGTILLVFLGIFALGKYLNEPNTPPNVVETPPIETPTQGTGSQVILKEVALLSSAYEVPKNPLDLDVFKALFPRVIINGSFEQAILSIKGKVGSSDAFLLLNFGSQGGLVRAVRESPNRLNIPQTLSRGGLFPAGSTIDISVNLLKDKLGTIGTEFIKTNLGEREFQFLDENEPIDVLPVAVIPFTNKGGYGGVTIGELTISYSCKPGSDCSIKTCDNNKVYTQCILDEHGKPAMEKWCRDHNTCNN